MYPAPPGAHSFTASPLSSLPPRPRHAQGTQDSGMGASGAPCQVLSSAQHHWAQWHQTGGPVSRGSVPRSGYAAPRGIRAESLVLCTHSCAPCKEQELTHTAHPHECSLAQSPAPRCSPCTHTLREAVCSTTVPAHAGPSPLTHTHTPASTARVTLRDSPRVRLPCPPPSPSLLLKPQPRAPGLPVCLP